MTIAVICTGRSTCPHTSAWPRRSIRRQLGTTRRGVATTRGCGPNRTIRKIVLTLTSFLIRMDWYPTHTNLPKGNNGEAANTYGSNYAGSHPLDP